MGDPFQHDTDLGRVTMNTEQLERKDHLVDRRAWPIGSSFVDRELRSRQKHFAGFGMFQMRNLIVGRRPQLDDEECSEVFAGSLGQSPHQSTESFPDRRITRNGQV